MAVLYRQLQEVAESLLNLRGAFWSLQLMRPLGDANVGTLALNLKLHFPPHLHIFEYCSGAAFSKR